jgi:hypothetical protein
VQSASALQALEPGLDIGPIEADVASRAYVRDAATSRGFGTPTFE